MTKRQILRQEAALQHKLLCAPHGKKRAALAALRAWRVERLRQELCRRIPPAPVPCQLF